MEKSELAVASELMMKGYGVLFPFGHNHQYDLIVDKGGDLYRIQVKTAKHEKGNRYYTNWTGRPAPVHYTPLTQGNHGLRIVHNISY